MLSTHSVRRHRRSRGGGGEEGKEKGRERKCRLGDLTTPPRGHGQGPGRGQDTARRRGGSSGRLAREARLASLPQRRLPACLEECTRKAREWGGSGFERRGAPQPQHRTAGTVDSLPTTSRGATRGTARGRRGTTARMHGKEETRKLGERGKSDSQGVPGVPGQAVKPQPATSCKAWPWPGRKGNLIVYFGAAPNHAALITTSCGYQCLSDTSVVVGHLAPADPQQRQAAKPSVPSGQRGGRSA